MARKLFERIRRNERKGDFGEKSRNRNAISVDDFLIIETNLDINEVIENLKNYDFGLKVESHITDILSVALNLIFFICIIQYNSNHLLLVDFFSRSPKWILNGLDVHATPLQSRLSGCKKKENQQNPLKEKNC
jgi:hypothetical protein